MKNIRDGIFDVAITVGCALGVGFISGKEAQVFFGNVINVVIFGIMFFVINMILREYCRKKNCGTPSALAKSCFKRVSGIFTLAISVCCFVCITTMLAGAEQCMSSIAEVSVLPLYGLICAVISAIVLAKGTKALKIINVTSIVLAVTLFTVLLCSKKNALAEDFTVPIYRPVIYALFTLTMSLGVVTELSKESSKKRNVICSAVSSVILCALMIITIKLSNFTLPLPTVSQINNPCVKALAVVTLILAAVTGIVANAYPVIEQLYEVLPDRTMCCIVIFGSALSLSMFGFDFAVKVGYVIVGVVGAATVIACAINAFAERAKTKAPAIKQKRFYNKCRGKQK